MRYFHKIIYSILFTSFFYSFYQFKEYKEFVIPVSTELRNFLAESTLEFQVWIIWTDDENLKELDKNDDKYETGLQKFITYELNNKEYLKRYQ